MDIIKLMYLNNKNMHEPIESTKREEDLMKKIEGLLPGDAVNILIELQEVQYNIVQEVLEKSYSCGFKDAISTINQLK